jgi:hypothetical protein
MPSPGIAALTYVSNRCWRPAFWKLLTDRFQPIIGIPLLWLGRGNLRLCLLRVDGFIPNVVTHAMRPILYKYSVA